MLPSGPIASDARRDSLPSARPAQALRGRCQPDTKTDLLLVPARAVMTGESVRPFGVQADERGRAACLPPKQCEVGMQTPVFRPFASPGPTSLWHFKGSACEVVRGKRQRVLE